MYCRNCGAKLRENEEKCESCSSETGEGKNKSERIVESYGTQVDKINMLRLLMSIVALLLVATVVFVPIYKCSFIPVSGDVSRMQDIKDVLEDGRVEKNFSLYEDFSQMLRILFDRTGEVGNEKLLVLEFGIFAIFEVLFAAILAALTVKRIIEYAIRIKKTEETALITYDGVKKYGYDYTRMGLFKKNTIIGLIIYAVFDVIFTQIFGFYTGTGEMNFFYRYMLDVSGLSAFFIIAAVLLMGVVALRILVAREEKKLYLEIIKENE